MAEKESFSLIVRDGIKIHGYEWNVDNPDAAICMSHGLGEHAGRYEHVASFFNENNISFYAIDLRGHGLSEGTRGHAPSHDRMLDDTEEFLMYVRSEHNDLPLFLYGHSLGGNIVTNYLLKKNVNELNGAIISSPWLKTVTEQPQWKVKLAKIVSKIFPSLTQPNGLDFNDLTNDDTVNQAYKNDPLVHDRASIKLFLEFSNAGEWALANADLLKLPVFMFHGSEDKMTSQQASQKFADGCGELVQYHIWKGSKHETHNDLDQKKVLNKILNWIKEKI